MILPPQTPQAPLFAASLPVQITVGCLCASYWRGAWYVLDYSLFPHDRIKSSAASLVLGSTLLGMNQYVLSPSYNGTKLLVRLLPPPRNYSLRTYYLKMNRFINLYMIAMSCVLVWRGAWLLWDELADRVSDLLTQDDDDKQDEITVVVSSEKATPSTSNNLPSASTKSTTVPPPRRHTTKRHQPHSDFWTIPQQQQQQQEHDAVSHHDVDRTLLFSGLASHIFATVGLLMIGRFKSVMAPPANVSMMKDIFLHGKGREFIRAARSFSKEKS